MIELIPGQVVEGVTGVLEARALAAQAVTPAGLEEAILRVFAPLQARIDQLCAQQANPIPVNPPQASQYVLVKMLCLIVTEHSQS